MNAVAFFENASTRGILSRPQGGQESARCWSVITIRMFGLISMKVEKWARAWLVRLRRVRALLDRDEVSKSIAATF